MNVIRVICMSITFLTSLSFARIKVTFDISTHQNKRPYQEDRFAHAIVKSGDFFGIYDGHCGDATSSYLQANMHNYFAELLSNKLSMKQAFYKAYAKAENYALSHYEDGSTAVTVYVDTTGKAHFAWVGDSRAVLEGNGKVAFSTLDHKPDRKEEQKRIENFGGTIEFFGVWRVNGLAVSRSIGDRSLKEMGEGQIIAVPEYMSVSLTSNNHFIIIASDGLWDVVSNEMAVNIIKEALKNNKKVSGVANLLQNKAIELGSGDNITVCVVLLEHEMQLKLGILQNVYFSLQSFWSWLWKS